MFREDLGFHASSRNMAPVETEVMSQSTSPRNSFWSSGHLPTLLTAFLYFDLTFAVWVLNAAMAPFISQELHLSDAQKGLMLAVPVFAGAFLRLPLGIASQIIGRKNAA